MTVNLDAHTGRQHPTWMGWLRLSRWWLVLTIAFTALAAGWGWCHAGVPLTDMVLYGQVYSRADQHQVLEQLEGPITVEILSQSGNRFVGSTSVLLAAAGSVREYYVIRLRRFEAGTRRGSDDEFVMPGDVLRISYAGVEVMETEHAAIMVTDALGDLRRLDLNRVDDEDIDQDGLPDDWERRFFSSLTQVSGSSSGGDGLPLFTIFALGLDPRVNNSSRMPFLRLEEGGALAYYFRQSTVASGLVFEVQAADDLATGSSWATLGITPQAVGQEGDSLILKVLIPEGATGARRFLRLNVR